MRLRRRRTLATLFTPALVAALTIAASSASPAQQAPGAARSSAAKKAPAGDPQVGKTRAPAQTKASDLPAPPKPVDDPVARRKMEDLLVRWEAQSKTVKSLAVKYKRTDVSPLFNATTEYLGEAKLKSPDFVYLDFYEVVDGKMKGAFSERIVSDGRNVYQFLGPPKQIFVFPLENDAQVKALNQGPLPFLFNMSAAKAKARYEMIFVSENDEAYFIKIIPKLAIDREEYSQALVKLRKMPNGRFLPAKIRLWSPNGQDTKTFDFGGDSLKENEEISTNWFDGPKMVTELSKYRNPKNPNDTKDRWILVVNPGPDGKPQPAPGVGAKPAAKGATPRR